MTQPDPRPSIVVQLDGPYAVSGGVPVGRPDGETTTRPRSMLCRCGGSANKPFCDGTHTGNGFQDG